MNCIHSIIYKNRDNRYHLGAKHHPQEILMAIHVNLYDYVHISDVLIARSLRDILTAVQMYQWAYKCIDTPTDILMAYRGTNSPEKY